MATPFALISSAAITPEEFMQLLQGSGAKLNPDEIYDGQLSREDQHVWIALDNDNLKVLEEQDWKLILSKLQGTPRTYITLDVSRTAGSEQLAVEFAYTCAQKWPCVVYNLLDKVYSGEDLYQLFITGKGFET